MKVLILILLTLCVSTIHTKKHKSLHVPFYNPMDEKANSGLKFLLNADYAKLLQNLDISKLVNGKVLDDKPVEFDIAAGTKVLLNKLSIKDVQTPKLVEVVSKQLGEKDATTDVTLHDIEVNIISSFDIQAAYIFKDSIVDGPISIQISSVDLQYHFINGHIKFDHLTVNIKDIQIKFQSIIFKTIYSIAKSLIISQINKAAEKYRTTIEEKINKFIDQQTILKVPVVNLFFNATSTEAPNLVFSDVKENSNNNHNLFQSLNLQNNQSEENIELFTLIMENFLQLPSDIIINKKDLENNRLLHYSHYDNKPNETNDVKAFLEFGFSGYMYSDPTQKVDFLPAVDMKFKQISYSHGVSLLLSDFTVNSLLNILKQSGKISVVLDKNTIIKGLPITIDTDGLQMLIPELKTRYPTKKDVKLSIQVPPLAETQPLIGTSVSEIHTQVVINFDLSVLESDDPFDDPVDVLSTKLNTVINLNPVFKEDKLTINIHDVSVDNVETVSTKFDKFDSEGFQTKVNNLIGLAVDLMIKPKLENIEIVPLVEKYTPFTIKNLKFDMMDQYNSICFDVEQKK